MKADIAVVGIGVMGANLARNFASRGLKVAVQHYKASTVAEFLEENPDMIGFTDMGELAASLKQPRRVILMVPAGKPVDDVLGQLEGVLDPDDIAVDAGNSHWEDTDRRASITAFRFVGMGVSGGAKGARLGPSMMPGGSRESWEALRPVLEAASAVSDSGPCVTWCGHGSAGHFVKMVHNGIEYGDMQLIAETDLLLRASGCSPTERRDVWSSWNRGRLESFLIEITAGIVAAADPEGDGPLVDQILDVAGQKGTGRWTAIAATMEGVPLSTVTAAVDARALSARKALRVRAQQVFGAPETTLDGVSTEDLEQALYASKLMSYTQGFELLKVASDERGYDTDLAAVSRIWKAGCIIRAVFLDRVYAALSEDPQRPLFLAPGFADEIRSALPAWRRVVAAAVSQGLPVPALASSLSYFDSLTRADGTANLIQAQRDWFGSHTFRRVTDPETAVHVDWEQLEQMT